MLHQNGMKCISSSYFKLNYNVHDTNDIICTTYVVHAINLLHVFSKYYCRMSLNAWYTPVNTRWH